jgi:hypothetical protein
MYFVKTISACLSVVFFSTLGSVVIAGPNVVVGTTVVDNDFVVSELTYSNRISKGFTLRWAARVIDGKIAICGAYQIIDPTLAQVSLRSIRRIYVKYEGRKIMTDGRFFARVNIQSSLIGASANCASMGIAAPNGGYRVQLGWHAS